MASKKPFLMGIGGGSGSGKSTIVQELKENIGPEKISVINYDAYYRNRPELTFEERQKINFDHPDSLETQLMVEHIKQLISGESVQIPIYDYAKHLRSLKTINVVPVSFLIPRYSVAFSHTSFVAAKASVSNTILFDMTSLLFSLSNF